MCLAELETLMERISDLGIDLAGAGHCNELEARESGNTVILGGGFHFTSYAKASFVINSIKKELVTSSYGTVRNRNASQNTDV